MAREPLEFDLEVVQQKLADAMTPGLVVEFEPDEAEAAGAFVDEALSELDAVESECDVTETAP